MTIVEGGAATAAPPTLHVAGTDPYPWPYDGVLTSTRAALVVVGAQRWFAPSVSPPVTALLDAARGANLRVLFTVHSGPTRGRRPPYLPLPGSPEAELLLEPAPGDAVVTASGLSACYGGPLEATLRAAGLDHVLLAGPGLEGPVHSTLRDLNDQGYECLLVADACGGDPTTRDGACSSVTMSGGIFGAVGTTAAVVAALREATASEHRRAARPEERNERGAGQWGKDFPAIER